MVQYKKISEEHLTLDRENYAGDVFCVVKEEGKDHAIFRIHHGDWYSDYGSEDNVDWLKEQYEKAETLKNQGLTFDDIGENDFDEEELNAFYELMEEVKKRGWKLWE